MSLLDTLDPALQPWATRLYDLAVQARVKPRVTSARRSYQQQEALYNTWLAGRSKYPAAPPGRSAHEYGLAFDMVVDNAVDQADLGTVWTSWGGVFGGEEDPVHFQYPGFSPTEGTALAAPPPPTSPSTRSKAEALADLLLTFLPIPLRGILNTSIVATEILAIFGANGASQIEWLLVHPAEAFDFFYEMLWGMIRNSLGL